MSEATATETELITEPARNGLASWEREQKRVLSNFDGDDRQKFAMQMRGLAASCGGDEGLGQVIQLQYWMIHEVEFHDSETGDVVKSFRTVLYEPSGASYAFVSSGVANGIREIFGHFGTDKLDPPLPVKVEQRKTQKGRRVYVLVPEAELPKTTARKRGAK